MATERKYLSFEKLSLYDEKIKKVISDGDAATLASAKSYADGLATNYDAAGSASTAQAAVQANLDAEIARAKGEEAKNAAAAKKAQDDVDALTTVVNGKAAQADLEALDARVGVIPTDAGVDNVVAYVQKQTSGIASEGVVTEIGNRVTTVEGKVATIEGDYLKGADKTELQGKIDLKAAQADLEAVQTVANAAVKQSDYDTKVAALEGEDARIAGLVTDEAAKAREEEGKLDARLVEVETFFKLAEGEQLDTALDTLVEIQGYITSEGAAADKMVEDIATNKKAIEDHVATDHDFAGADATLKAELEGQIALKANTSALNELAGKVTTDEDKITANEQAIAALQGADTTMSGRIDVLEAKFGGAEGSVEDMIADAKAEAIDAAAGDATTKANKALADAKTYADGKDTAMNARVEALEAVDHTHSNKDLLDTYTQTEVDLADAVAKKHAHANATVLDGITAEKVTAWDKVSGKAEQTALQAEIERAMAAEKANADAIALFQEISEAEINALFNA